MEQVLRLQVNKLAMIMGYTSSVNLVVVVFHNKMLFAHVIISDLCHNDIFVHVSAQLLL